MMIILIILALYIGIGIFLLNKEINGPVMRKTALVHQKRYFVYVMTWPIKVIANSMF